MKQNEHRTGSFIVCRCGRAWRRNPSQRMSLQGIAPQQTFPGAIVADLRDYAAALKLPPDWTKRITAKQFRTPIDNTTQWFFDYEGKPFATYSLTLLDEIDEAKRHVPIPAPPDPLVVATELALKQPTNPDFRRFNDCVFRVSEVAAIDGKFIDGGVKKLRVIMRNSERFVCDNEPNYANSGMSTFEWFLEHVMQLRPEHADRRDTR